LLKTGFWRVAEFDVEMMKMVFAICMAIWNVVYCLRMCMLDNKLQTFSTWFYFNNFVDEKFCGTGFTFLLHVSDWKACLWRM
jgi:hypothetical protein